MQYYIKPLERLYDDQTKNSAVANKVLTNDILDDPYEKDEGFDYEDSYNGNYAALPPTVDTIRLISQDETMAVEQQEQKKSNEDEDDFVNTVRKTRPLPQIPSRNSSKEISKDMTLILAESLKKQNRVSAQQLFSLLSQSKLNQENQQSDEEESPEDDSSCVYALKTQVSTLRLSNKDILNDYYQFGTKKIMTPVQEVDEEENENEYFHNYTDEKDTVARSSDSSLSPPSLASGRTSPVSHRESLELENHPNMSSDNNSSITNLSDSNVQPLSSIVDDDDSDDNSFTSPFQSLKHGRSVSFAPNVNESLYADVCRLSQQSHIPVSNNTSNISSAYSAAVDEAHDHTGFSITSLGITHDKEAIKTFRRMATKTNDRHIQFNYAKHLIQLVSMYTNKGTLDFEALATRSRLQEEAEYWIDKLAKSNYGPAMYIKGQWHRQCGNKKFKDIFVGTQYKKVDHDKAFKCFQQAAKYSCVEAYYELAEYWMVRKNYKKSVLFYKYAASKNHIPSLYKLANIMLRGLLQQKKNIPQGLVYLRQAADAKKPESSFSAYDYACIISGDLESIDLESDSQIMAVCNTYDFKTAIRYFKIAEEFGCVNAGYRLGQIYKNGEKGTQMNLWKAYHFFSRAANHHHEGAMIEVSKLYKSGIPGCLKDQPSLAFQWCFHAAKKGNRGAEYLIGTYYEEGVGVHPDYNEALEWYKKSAGKEYRLALEKLNPSYHTESPAEEYVM